MHFFHFNLNILKGEMIANLTEVLVDSLIHCVQPAKTGQNSDGRPFRLILRILQGETIANFFEEVLVD